MPKRVLITGSRTWDDRDVVVEAFIKAIAYLGTSEFIVVSGACPIGADRICEEEWIGDIERHPADWLTHGKKAGFVRNAEMVGLGADLCLAFIQADSKGASMTADLARKAGIETWTFRAA